MTTTSGFPRASFRRTTSSHPPWTKIFYWVGISTRPISMTSTYPQNISSVWIIRQILSLSLPWLGLGSPVPCSAIACEACCRALSISPQCCRAWSLCLTTWSNSARLGPGRLSPPCGMLSDGPRLTDPRPRKLNHPYPGLLTENPLGPHPGLHYHHLHYHQVLSAYLNKPTPPIPPLNYLH